MSPQSEVLVAQVVRFTIYLHLLLLLKHYTVFVKEFHGVVYKILST